LHISLLPPHCIRGHGPAAATEQRPRAAAQAQKRCWGRPVSRCFVLGLSATATNCPVLQPLSGEHLGFARRSAASLRHGSAHTKYHAGLVVSRSLGAGRRKLFPRQGRSWRALSRVPARAEQGAGVGQGCGSLPVLPITHPVLDTPHGPLLLQAPRRGACGLCGVGVRPAAGTRASAGGQKRASLGDSHRPGHRHSHLCLPHRPHTPGTEHHGCPGVLSRRRVAAAAVMTGHCLSSSCHTSPG